MDLNTLTAIAAKQLESSSGRLKIFQENHFVEFKKIGLEFSDPEFYKFTKIPRFIDELQLDPKESYPLDVEKYRDPKHPTFLFLDGKLVGPSPSIKGLSYKSIHDNFAEVEGMLGQQNAFSHFHHSLLHGGLLIDVDNNTQIDLPIRIIHLNASSQFTAPSLIIRAGKNSQVTILEEAVGIAPEYAFISETLVLCADGAKIEHIQIDHGKEKSLHHISTTAQLGRDSDFKSFIFHLGGKLNRKDVSLKLNESGANAESYALLMTENHEHSDLNTVIHHLAADTTSAQIAKGILDDESKGIFTGKIHIHPHAQRVKSGQLNKNLLLSNKAQAHSQPQLEIFADDVKCSHGSTTGQLSEEEVFYFQTRGIPADRARSLLAYGFGLDIVLKIQNEDARSIVEKIIKNKLQQKFNLKGQL